MKAEILAGLILAAHMTDIPVYDKQYRHKETIRPTTPNSYTIYDNKWRNTGTIRTHPDGSIDIYEPNGTRRIPTLRPSTPIIPDRRPK